MYSRSSTHVGNSLILFFPSGNKSSVPVPGSITNIRRRGNQYFIDVRRQCPLPPGTFDPFEEYKDFPAALYSASLTQAVETIELDWIAAHYARYPWTENEAVVLSLSRVSCSIFSTSDLTISGLNI